ncbi:hypothetical protein VAR608DRAFT_4900 [Variovorax sp. HW608]|uniref:hypothetical protein n=1 Tax=Variovorax sp. HW608 TaxID=1034889 RepID=UPI00081FF2F9|nr:hypothetical protein [Variovorax sp. HW608]SCK49248.1 hypothetical protein VAR608DRAFT_4900 [Variovorax sp. HW608]
MTPTPPEYCLFWINHWSTCMQKGEWSGWAQAFGTFVAMGVAIGAAYLQAHFASLLEARRGAERVRALARTLDHWRETCEELFAIPIALKPVEVIFALESGLR